MVYGYIRASTEDQELTITAQLDQIHRACSIKDSIPGEDRYNRVTIVSDEGQSGKDLDRPGMNSLLDNITSGDILMVTKLDRLSRSVIDFSTLLRRSQEEGWDIVALDVQLDTSHPTGKLVATIIMAVAEWEREMIGVRTKEALAEKKKKGEPLGGAAHKRQISSEIVNHILYLRQHPSYLSINSIAQSLNVRYPGQAPRGGEWTKSTVQSVLERNESDAK